VEAVHGEARLLARPRGRLRHLSRELRRERLVGPLGALRPGVVVSRPQGRLVVGAGGYGAVRRRGGGGVPERRRPFDLRPLTGASTILRSTSAYRCATPRTRRS
jgi:hypothetical protein